MNAYTLEEPFKLIEKEILSPEKLEDDEVLIKIKNIGICGSDLLGYQGKMAFMSYPRIPGHEFSGIVEKAGNNVTKVKTGDRVCVEPLVVCGKCEPCLCGEYNVCQDMKVLGVHIDGAFCEKIIVKERSIYALPKNMSFEEGALIEPFCVALEAVRRTALTIEDAITIFGAGTIGLCILKAALAIGARKTFIVDINEYRLSVAKKMGADYTATSYDEIIDITKGRGTDVVIEASGAGKAAEDIFKVASYRGRIGILAFYKTPLVNIPPTEIVKKELDIFGSRLYQKRFPLALDLVSKKKVELIDLVTHRFSFDELEKAFQAGLNQDSKALKIMVKTD